MRIKVTFKNQNNISYLPINTNYYLLKLINQLTYEYHRYLNSLVSGRRRKKFDLYTFSQLIIPDRIISDFKIGIKSSEFYWYLSSPYYQFLGLVAKELRERNHIRIAEKWFGVADVRFISPPDFSESEARFTCLSPVAVYRQAEPDPLLPDEYFSGDYVLPGESEYLKFLERNLVYKYNILRKQNRKHLNFELEFDRSYVKKRNNKITKVITLETEDTIPEQIRGVLAPVHIKAEPDVLQLIYDAGLGQLNNLGFGMVETVHAHRSTVN